MEHEGRSLWQMLVAIQEADGDFRINCTECLALLAYDSDLLVSGADVHALDDRIHYHLSLCKACQKEQGVI